MIFLSILFLVVLVWVLYLVRRLGHVNSELELLRTRDAFHERLISLLTQRVWTLEQASRQHETSSLAAPELPATPPMPEPLPVSAPPPAPEPQPVAVVATPVESGEDWETMLGTNWLNRAGALILVVGIALFLGYSLTQLGPAGKVTIGMVAGLSMLVGGTILANGERYRGFALSFTGAGWAIVYFTAYAMHGVPAARVIESPTAGTVLLAVVSVCMIGHALLYRSETATALAFLFGFVSLNVSPLTTFSVAASLILALSLIGIAYRFDWFRLPLAGVLATYLTFLLRYDASIYGRAGVLNGQSTLWIYWLAFEAYDLLDLRRRGAVQSIERSLFLLNAAGFIGASLLHEFRMSAQDWSTFLGISSVAYLASAVLRARWTQDHRSTPERVLGGGSEGAATASAGLMAAALIERFSGLGITLALLLEGEMVFLTGLALSNRYIVHLGSFLLGLSFFRLLGVDAPAGGQTYLGSLQLERWTPAGAVMTATFVINRRLVPQAWFYLAAAGVLSLGIIAVEFPERCVAPIWAVLAIAAFLAGERFGQRDIQWMAFPVAMLAAGAALVSNVVEGQVFTTVLVVLATYAHQMLWRNKVAPLASTLSVAGTALLTALVFHEVQGRLLTVACGFEGAALLIAGFVLKERSFRLSGLLLFLFCIGKLFVYDLRELDAGSRILSFIVLGVMLLAASWVYSRFRDKIRRLL